MQRSRHQKYNRQRLKYLYEVINRVPPDLAPLAELIAYCSRVREERITQAELPEVGKKAPGSNQIETARGPKEAVPIPVEDEPTKPIAAKVSKPAVALKPIPAAKKAESSSSDEDEPPTKSAAKPAHSGAPI